MVYLVTKFMPDEEFVAFVKGLPNKDKRILSVEGFNRWHIRETDGTEYILRPESSRKNL